MVLTFCFEFILQAGSQGLQTLHLLLLKIFSMVVSVMVLWADLIGYFVIWLIGWLFGWFG